MLTLPYSTLLQNYSTGPARRTCPHSIALRGKAIVGNTAYTHKHVSSATVIVSCSDAPNSLVAILSLINPRPEASHCFHDDRFHLSGKETLANRIARRCSSPTLATRVCRRHREGHARWVAWLVPSAPSSRTFCRLSFSVQVGAPENDKFGRFLRMTMTGSLHLWDSIFNK